MSTTGRTAMRWWFVGIVIPAIVVSTDALAQKSLQELEAASRFEQALAAVDAIQHRKKLQCVLSIANTALCDCLSRKLPVTTYFRSYPSITSQKRDTPEYKQLSAADMKVVDQCVSDGQ